MREQQQQSDLSPSMVTGASPGANASPGGIENGAHWQLAGLPRREDARTRGAGGRLVQGQPCCMAYCERWRALDGDCQGSSLEPTMLAVQYVRLRQVKLAL